MHGFAGFDTSHFFLLAIIISYLLRRERINTEEKLKVGELEIIGRAVRTSKGYVAVFTGIPYAQPPTATLRFKKPVLKLLPSGPGVLNATATPSACLQNVYNPFPAFLSKVQPQSEDCLYLNIFTRREWINNIPTDNVADPTAENSHANGHNDETAISEEASEKAGSPERDGIPGGYKGYQEGVIEGMPVIVYIHGGSFSNGDGISRDGTGLVSQENVLFVSMNYRLGLMGFMNHHPAITANLALWDVVTALQWIQLYIHHFGGNSNKVTIMGESAGGAIVSHLHSSPLTTDLFARAVAISGSSLAPWAMTRRREREQMDKWDVLMDVTGCREEEDVVQCLQQATPSQLSDVMKRAMERCPIDCWAPVVDGLLIPLAPLAMMNKTGTPKRPLLSGLVQNEGSHMAVAVSLFSSVDIYSDSAQLTVEQVRMLSIEHDLLQNSTIPCLKDSGGSLISLYLPNTDVKDYKTVLSYILGDRLLFCPQIAAANSLTLAGTHVFQYIFDYTPIMLQDPESTWRGVEHGTDMAFLLGLPFSANSPFSNGSNLFYPRDRQISRVMMRILASFASDGKPSTPRNKLCWKSLKNSHNFLRVTGDRITVDDLSETMEFCERSDDAVREHRIPC